MTIHSLLMASLLMVPSQEPSVPGVSIRIQGESEISTDSRWHKNLELKLKTKGRHHFTLGGLSGLKAGEEKPLAPADLQSLMEAIRDVEWEADDTAKYTRWLGSNIRSQSLSPEVSTVSVKATALEGGSLRVELKGTMAGTDTGQKTRYGPSSWKDEWTHKIDGWFRLEPDGYISQVELTNEFEVEGVFYTGTIKENTSGKNTRNGTLKLIKPRSTPLTEKQKREVLRLLGRLGNEEFDVRHAATKRLMKMAADNDAVLDRVRDRGVSSVNPEVRIRILAILEQAE